MSWDFGEYCDVYYDDANFLDAHSEVSFFTRFRFNSINTGVSQYIFAHVGATNKFSFRKNASDTYFRWSMTSGGVFVPSDDVVTPVADTVYSFAGRWKKNDASGMELWRDGTSEDTSSTTTQSSDYDSGGSVDLYVGAFSFNNAYCKADIQELMLWTGHSLTQLQVTQLHQGFHWLEIPGLPKPAVWYDFEGRLLTRLPDRSGNGRHIEAATIDVSTPPTDGGILLPRSPRSIHVFGSSKREAASGGGPPNPWTFYEDVLHPVAASTVTGLTNTTTYEFKINAADESGNVSQDSAIVEATPTEPTPSVSDYRIPWKRPKRKSKYRSTQQ
jgi:hypothetical protein